MPESCMRRNRNAWPKSKHLVNNRFTLIGPKKGDVAKIITTGEKVVIIEYKVNYAGSVFNALDRSESNKFPDSVVTDLVLCEGRIDGKFQKKKVYPRSKS